jgi:hypothetical protein
MTPANQKAWLEAKIESDARDLVKSLGGIAYKFTSPSRMSVPDRVIVLPNQPIFFIEYKRWGKKCSPGQVREGILLLQMGHFVYYVDNKPESDYIIKEWAKGVQPDMYEFSAPQCREMFE